jgi:hypothetical protein
MVGDEACIRQGLCQQPEHRVGDEKTPDSDHSAGGCSSLLRMSEEVGAVESPAFRKIHLYGELNPSPQQTRDVATGRRGRAARSRAPHLSDRR